MSVIHDPRSIKASRRKDMLQKVGLMRRQYISIFDTVEQQSKLIKEYNPHAIKGYASSLAILADFITQQSSLFILARYSAAQNYWTTKLEN